MPTEAEIEKQFMEMDKDSSGLLDMTALEDLLHLLGVTPIQPGDDRRCANQDDCVRSLFGRASFTTTRADNLPAMQMKAYSRHLAAVVKQFDVSGGGLLNLSEFKQMVRAVVRQQMSLKPVTRMQGKWAKPPADVAEPARTASATPARGVVHPEAAFLEALAGAAAVYSSSTRAAAVTPEAAALAAVPAAAPAAS